LVLILLWNRGNYLARWIMKPFNNPFKLNRAFSKRWFGSGGFPFQSFQILGGRSFMIISIKSMEKIRKTRFREELPQASLRLKLLDFNLIDRCEVCSFLCDRSLSSLWFEGKLSFKVLTIHLESGSFTFFWFFSNLNIIEWNIVVFVHLLRSF
jgi:hypothetical protein